MSIVAALDKVLFFNASSKYSVLRMKTEDSSVPAEARSPYRYHDHLIRFTAVGIELPQTDTVKIEMDGEWKDGKYGLQLQVDHWQEIVPPTLEGVRNYLASGLLKGIGEKTADAIIEKFGINALEILEHQPDRLLEIRGITKERLAEIKDAYAETSRMRVLMTLLAPFKVTPTTAQKIYQHFGPSCADIVRQSPFNLCQVPGFGFKRIDAIVQKSGGDLRDPKRVHGALFYALEDARTKDGHLYLEAEALLKAAMQLLNERILFRCLNLIGNGKQGKNEEAFILCLVPPIGNTLVSQCVEFSLIRKIICTKTRCVALNEPGCKWLSMDGFDLLVSMIDCD